MSLVLWETTDSPTLIRDKIRAPRIFIKVYEDKYDKATNANRGN